MRSRRWDDSAPDGPTSPESTTAIWLNRTHGWVSMSVVVDTPAPYAALDADAVMRQHDISSAFAFDPHFEERGFRLV